MVPRAIQIMLTLVRHHKLLFFGKQHFPTCSCEHNDHVRSFTTAITANKLGVRQTNVERLSLKEVIIKSLNLRCAEDASPFYELPISTLCTIQRATLSDVRNGFCENRLYYISSRIQCPPAELSEKLAKRVFVYTLSFDWLENSLNVLIDKGVSGDRILRDLWVLRYHHKTISEKLQKIKDMGISNLCPWMVRCSPDILNRYMKITQDTKSILGETKSTKMYLANRLNVSIEDVEEMCVKIPALKSIRATKVKHFLDFLIQEGFDIVEIRNKPRILASSLKTVKLRLEQLRKLGLRHINLNLLCRSRKDYKKIIETLGVEFKNC